MILNKGLYWVEYDLKGKYLGSHPIHLDCFYLSKEMDIDTFLLKARDKLSSQLKTFRRIIRVYIQTGSQQETIWKVKNGIRSKKAESEKEGKAMERS